MAGITWGGLVPHPPLIIPAIGQDDIRQVAATSESMTAVSQEIKELDPDAVVIISPHGPFFHDGVPIWDLETLKGSFSRFGYPHVRFQATLDKDLTDRIIENSIKAKIPVVRLDEEMTQRLSIRKELDHGVMVPLYFLQKEKITAPLVLLSIGLVSDKDLLALGKAIQNAASDSGKNIVILASGDLSHCLSDKAPAGYSEAGEMFDSSLKEYIESGQLEKILYMDRSLVDGAAECGYKPILILMGALTGLSVQSEVLSYEGPFGVGYMTARFRVTGQAQQADWEASTVVGFDPESVNPVAAWAKKCLETYVYQGKKQPMPKPLPKELNRKAGVFVSIKKLGLLRGCIGTVFPVQDNIAQEIRENAISAGTRDPRFYPVKQEELPHLTYSVDVLSDPEPVPDSSWLDPQVFGVIVRQGNCVGLLLPNLEGVNTIDEQIRIACEKAGIDPDSAYGIERFQVTRHG